MGAILSKQDIVDPDVLMSKFYQEKGMGKIIGLKIQPCNIHYCLWDQDLTLIRPDESYQRSVWIHPEREQSNMMITGDCATLFCDNEQELLKCAMIIHYTCHKIPDVKSSICPLHWAANANEVVIEKEYEREYA